MKNLFCLIACSLFILSGCVNSNSKAGKEGACCSEQKESLLYVMNLHRKVKPEYVAEFKASFEKCKVSTMEEPGCLDYGMYQSYTDSCVFFIAETWINKQAHRDHMETPHLKLHIQEINGMGDPAFKSTADAEIYVCPHVNP